MFFQNFHFQPLRAVSRRLIAALPKRESCHQGHVPRSRTSDPWVPQLLRPRRTTARSFHPRRPFIGGSPLEPHNPRTIPNGVHFPHADAVGEGALAARDAACRADAVFQGPGRDGDDDAHDDADAAAADEGDEGAQLGQEAMRALQGMPLSIGGGGKGRREEDEEEANGLVG